jgi:hypothetical protein
MSIAIVDLECDYYLHLDEDSVSVDRSKGQLTIPTYIEGKSGTSGMILVCLE